MKFQEKSENGEVNENTNMVGNDRILHGEVVPILEI
jgi:hypothetical protein